MQPGLLLTVSETNDEVVVAKSHNIMLKVPKIEECVLDDSMVEYEKIHWTGWEGWEDHHTPIMSLLPNEEEDLDSDVEEVNESDDGTSSSSSSSILARF